MERTTKPVAIAAAIICAGLLTAVPITSQAQQFSARGMSGNMNLARLQRAISAMKKDMAALNNEHDQLMACQEKGMAYAPANENSDNNGCLNSGVKIGLAPPHKCSGDWCSVNSTDQVAPPGTDCTAFVAIVHSNYRYVSTHCTYDKPTGSIHITSGNGWGRCGYVCKN